MTDDYSDYTNEDKTDLLTRISEVAQKQLGIEAEIAKAEQRLKELQQDHLNVTQFELPELMDEAGMTQFKLRDGSLVTITESIRASIPSSNPTPALNWLRENGHGHVIKNDYTVSFGKGEEDKAKEFGEELKSHDDLKYKNKEHVHWQTLQSVLKEQLEEGVDVPLDIFGAYPQKITKIKVA